MTAAGTTFLSEMPPGYDERATLALGPGNTIVAAHPDHPPVYYDEQRKEWVRLDKCKEEADHGPI